MPLTFTPADIALWQREVDYWAAAFDSAWDERSHAKIEAARVAIRALLDLRDDVQAEAQRTRKVYISNLMRCARDDLP